MCHSQDIKRNKKIRCSRFKVKFEHPACNSFFRQRESSHPTLVLLLLEKTMLDQWLLRIHFNNSDVVPFSSETIKTYKNIYRHLCITSLLDVFLRMCKLKTTGIQGIRKGNVWLLQNPLFKMGWSATTAAQIYHLLVWTHQKRSATDFTTLLFLLQDKKRK